MAVALGVAAMPAAAHADPGLIAEWGFDEGTGQVVRDAGPFGLDGRLGATAGAEPADPERIPGLTGGALHFDGSTFVSLPGSARLQPQQMTVDAVVRAPSSPGAYRYILSGGGDGCWSGSYGLYTAPAGGLAFYVYDGRRYVLSATARPADVWDGAWHAVTATYDGAALRLFVDGRAVGDPMPAANPIEYGLPSTGTTIGAYAGACDLGFAGDVDRITLRSGASDPGKGGNAAAPGPGTPGGGGTTGPAPVKHSPLRPAAPGMILHAPRHPSAEPKACTVRLSRTRVAPGRRVVLRARLAGATGKQRRSLTVRRGRKLVTTARLKSSREARIVLRPQRVGKLTVRVAKCSSATLSVRH